MMDDIARIQRGIDLAESDLTRDFSTAQIAAAAHLSAWHFQRTFKALTGETLKAYIRQRRLQAAVRALVESDAKILDIALNAGYDSHESFTRAFKQAFDRTPAQARDAGGVGNNIVRPRIDETYLRHLQQALSIDPDIYTQPAMTLVGLHTRFFGSYSDLNNVSAKLPPLWQAFMPRITQIERAVPGLCYGVVRQVSADSDELEYFCAMESAMDTQPPEGMVRVDIPACTYAKFRHRGDVARIDDTINYIYAVWLPRSGYRHTYGPDLEFYDERYQPNSDNSVMYYAIPIA